MKIGIISNGNTTTPPTSSWGPHNLIVSSLTEGLQERGHQVTLWARPGSKTKSKLKTLDIENMAAFNYHAIRDALDEGVEILHYPSHMFPHNLVPLPIPQVITYGHNASVRARSIWGFLLKVLDFNQSVSHVSISGSHIKMCPRYLNYEVIHHALDPKEFNDSIERTGDYLATFSRITPYKGIDLAIKVAMQSKMKLKIAGPICPEQREQSQKYFNKCIAPYLRESEIEYIGEITGTEEKQSFLRNAKALLHPIRWPEPFGLSLLDSMFVGTPVIAFRRGSSEEIIKNGVSGYVVDSLDDMADAVLRVDGISRKEVRAYAEQMFTTDKMVDKYEMLFIKTCEQFRPLTEVQEDDYLRLLSALAPTNLGNDPWQFFPSMINLIEFFEKVTNKKFPIPKWELHTKFSGVKLEVLWEMIKWKWKLRGTSFQF